MWKQVNFYLINSYFSKTNNFQNIFINQGSKKRYFYKIILKSVEL